MEQHKEPRNRFIQIYKLIFNIGTKTMQWIVFSTNGAGKTFNYTQMINKHMKQCSNVTHH